MKKFELANPGSLRDSLVAAVLEGKKIATSSLLSDWELEGRALPQPGEQQVLINSQEEPVAIIEIENIKQYKLGEVDDRVARDEGEGFRGASEWRRAHEKFWLGDRYDAAAAKWQLPDDTSIVVEWFRVARLVG